MRKWNKWFYGGFSTPTTPLHKFTSIKMLYSPEKFTSIRILYFSKKMLYRWYD